MTKPEPNQNYRQEYDIGLIGNTIEVPRQATGITVSSINPFEDSVRVSYLLPDPDGEMGVNKFVIRKAASRPEGFTVPRCAVGVTSDLIREEVFYLV